ncbi:hypothetical protein [Rugosimonospora africana]|uniref:Uncharacterized protein n=1 Tax=Rugosimonospora africana TaxID=556532 RepID=A0A8J3QLE0_9ACTN|nr:hypothetical protein [Rugosimonospora africana]GIH13098.1 hypothetical protein Raf01_12700 [Rugosimonospora africana]
MDTLEWGNSDTRSERAPRIRAMAALTGGRRMAIVLAVLAFVALVAAELLPWATLRGAVDGASTVDVGSISGFDSGSGRFSVALPPSTLHPDPYTVGLGQIASGSTLVYHLGALLLFAFVGAALLARPAQRRLATGLGLGVLAGMVVVVVGMVHSFNTLLPTTTYTGGTSSFRSTLTNVPDTVLAASTTVNPGTFFAFGALALLLAALAVSVLPDQVRVRLVTGAAEPVDAQFTDEPPDLTVTPVSPVEASVTPYFGRPDGASR